MKTFSLSCAAPWFPFGKLWKMGLTALWLAIGSIYAHAQPELVGHTDTILQYRAEKKMELISPPRGPLTVQDTSLVDYFPIQSEWVKVAHFTATPEERMFDLPTYSGITRPYLKYGYLEFKHGERSYRLYVYRNLQLAQKPEYRDYLFLPLTDATTGESTYGGGRYMDLRMGDIREDKTVIIDFNKLYNPWCAYSDGFNCPIPPQENSLDLAITAGERNYRGEKKH